MAEREIFCSIGIDIDAVAGWLGSYGGEDSPDDISRGMFSGEVGTLRLDTNRNRIASRSIFYIDSPVGAFQSHTSTPGAIDEGRLGSSHFFRRT